MYTYTQGHSRIISSGSCIPDDIITTRELLEGAQVKERFGISNNWLQRITGIREKRVAAAGTLPSDMAVMAAREALERAATDIKEVGIIIFTGGTRDYLVEPSTAHVVQSKLGASNATVFDVSNACHGFMNGIHLMDALIATGQVRKGLVVTGEQGSLYANLAVEQLRHSDNKQDLVDLAGGLTLGDAGAALLMGPRTDPDSGFAGFMLQSKGEYARLCYCGEENRHGPVVTDMPGIVGRTLPLISGMYKQLMDEHLHWRTEELDKYIIHQVGATSFKLHEQHVGVPVDIMPNTVVTMGNLITATIPVNLHNIAINKEVEAGNKVYLSGAGSGVSLSQVGLVWDMAA